MLKRNISIVFLIAVFTKGLGFLRDIVLVNQLGAGAQTDTFVAINSIIESLITLFGIQTLFSSSTTIFTEAESKKSDRSIVFSSFSIILLFLTIPLMLGIMMFPSMFLNAMFPGFSTQTSNKASMILIFFSINIVVLSLIRSYNAIFGVHRKFIFQNLFPLIINLAIILITLTVTSDHIILILCLSLTITQIMFLFIQIVMLNYLKYHFIIPPIDSIKSTAFRTKTLAGPLVIVTCISSLAGIVSQLLGSQCQEGTITLLNLGNNLVFFSIGLIFMSTINVLFPEFSRLSNENNLVELSRLVNKTIEFALAVFIPISVFFIVNSEEVVRGIFFRNNFPEETVSTLSTILIIFGFALVPQVFGLIPNYLLQSCGKNKKTAVAALIAFPMNMLIAFVVTKFYGYIGIALGLTVGHFIFSGLMLFFAEKETGITMRKTCINNGFIIIFVSIIWIILVNLLPIPSLFDSVGFLPVSLKNLTTLMIRSQYFIFTFISIWIVYEKILKRPILSAKRML